MEHPFAIKTTDSNRHGSTEPSELSENALEYINGAFTPNRIMPWIKPPVATTQALGEEGGDFPPSAEF